MPTILVIDDIPQMANVVCHAVPECEVVHACDGVSGLKILQNKNRRFDLILLDNRMIGKLDGPTTALKIREINRTTPIRLFTAYEDPLVTRMLGELGGGLPIFKPIEPDELAREIRASIGMEVIVCPGEAVMEFASKSLATERVNDARNDQTKRIGVFAENRMKQGGLRLLLETSGYSVPLLMGKFSAVVDAMEMYDQLLVATAPQHLHLMFELPLPVICIAQNLKEVIQSVDIVKRFKSPIGLVVECNEMSLKVSGMVREAINCISEGKTFLPLEMEDPFYNHETLSKREKEYIRFEMMGMTTEDISRQENVELGSVRSLRRRVRERLELGQDDDLQEWAERWWFNRFFGINGVV